MAGKEVYRQWKIDFEERSSEVIEVDDELKEKVFSSDRLKVA